MQTKFTLLFALIASIEFVHGSPFLGDLLGGSKDGGILDSVVGEKGVVTTLLSAKDGGILDSVTGILSGGGKKKSSGSSVNPNGLLSPANSLLKDPLCSMGLACDDCDGPLKVLNPTLQEPLNYLGLGVDGKKGSGGKGSGGKGSGGKGSGGKGSGGKGNGKGNSNILPTGSLKGLSAILQQLLCLIGLGCEDCVGVLQGINPFLVELIQSAGFCGCNGSGCGDDWNDNSSNDSDCDDNSSDDDDWDDDWSNDDSCDDDWSNDDSCDDDWSNDSNDHGEGNGKGYGQGNGKNNGKW